MKFIYPPNVVQTILDASGKPIVGAKVYAYQSGTDIPTLLFTIDGTPLTWPVVSDSYGIVNFALLNGVNYLLRYFTPEDVFMYERDVILTDTGEYITTDTAPSDIGNITFELVSDTLLRVKVKGSDNTIRSSDITLA